MYKNNKDIVSCIQEKERLKEKLSSLPFRLPNLAAMIYYEKKLPMSTKKFCNLSSKEVSEFLGGILGFDKEFIMDCANALKRYLERMEYFEEMEQHYGCSALEYHYEQIIEE